MDLLYRINYVRVNAQSGMMEISDNMCINY